MNHIKPVLKIAKSHTLSKRIQKNYKKSTSRHLHTTNSSTIGKVPPDVTNLLKRQAVLITGLNLLPSSDRKPYTSSTADHIFAHHHAVPQQFDLFKSQDTANKLAKHIQSIDFNKDHNTSISSEVKDCILSNIDPVQRNITQRNHKSISNIPKAGALFKSQPNQFSFPKPTISSSSSDYALNLNGDNQPVKLSPTETQQYAIQLKTLSHTHSTIQRCKQMLSIKQLELHQSALLLTNQNIIGTSGHRKDKKFCFGPFLNIFTRTELFQHNLRTILSTSSNNTNDKDTHDKTTALVHDINQKLIDLVHKKKQIIDLEDKMAHHLLFKALPIVYARFLHSNSTDMHMGKHLTQKLHEINGNWNGTSFTPFAPTNANTNANTNTNTNSINNNNIQLASPSFLAQSTIPTNHTVPAALQTIHNIRSTISDFLTPLISASQSVSQSVSHLSINEKTTESLLLAFKQNNMITSTPEFVTLLKKFIQNDDIFDNHLVHNTFLYKEYLTSLKNFVPVAAQLEDLLDIPAFKLDKNITFGEDALFIEQQAHKLTSNLQDTIIEASLQTFSKNIIQRDTLALSTTINTLNECGKIISGSLPKHVQHSIPHYGQNITTGNNELVDDISADTMTPIDNTGEYVYNGQKWSDIVKDKNLYTHLTLVDQLQSSVVQFHEKQQDDFQQIIHQQLVHITQQQQTHIDSNNINTSQNNMNNNKKTRKFIHSDDDSSFNSHHNNNIDNYTGYNTNDPHSLQYQDQTNQLEQRDLSQLTTNLIQIQTHLRHLLTLPNSINIETSQINKNDKMNKKNKKIETDIDFDHFPLHTLKSSLSASQSDKHSKLHKNHTIDNITTENQDASLNQIILKNNEEIQHTIDQYNHLIQAYEKQNKSSTFRYRRTTAPTVPLYTNAYAFDIDGVLLKDGHLIPGAKEALSSLFSTSHGGTSRNDLNTPVVFMTNGGGVTEKDKAKELSELFDLRINSDQIILASTPWRALIPTLKDKKIAIIGGKRSVQVAQDYGFVNSFPINQLREQHCDLLSPQAVQDDPVKYKGPTSLFKAKKRLSDVEAMMIWTDSRDWYVDLQIALDVLIASREKSEKELGIPIGTYKNDKHLFSTHFQKISENQHIEQKLTYQATNLISDCPIDYYNVMNSYFEQYTPIHTPLLLSNPDFVYSNRYDKPRLAQGSFAETLSYLYTRLTGEPLEYLTCGKPTTITYRLAEGKLLRQAQEQAIHYSNSMMSTGNDQYQFGLNDINKPLTTNRPVVISQIYGIGDNPCADIRGANWAGTPWTSVFVHTGTIPLDFSFQHHGNGFSGAGKTAHAHIDLLAKKIAETPSLEYPSVFECIHEIETIHDIAHSKLSLKL